MALSTHIVILCSSLLLLVTVGCLPDRTNATIMEVPAGDGQTFGCSPYLSSAHHVLLQAFQPGNVEQYQAS